MKRIFYLLLAFLVMGVLSFALVIQFNSLKVETFIYQAIEKPLLNLCLFQSKEKPLLHCRSSCRVDKNLLDQKIKKGLPFWANKQIQEDLATLKSEKKINFTEILEKNGVTNNIINLVQFVIQDGIVSVILPTLPKNLSVSYQKEILLLAEKQYEPMQDVLGYLSKNNYIPNTTFILGINDFAVIKEHKFLPVFTYAKDLDRQSEKHLILMPDWMNLCSSSSLRNKIRRANLNHPWINKKNQAFWRGGMNDSTQFRQKTVVFSKKHPAVINASFVAPGKSPFVTPEDHLHYQYLISIDGARCSWERLVWHLHSNSLLLKHQSNQVQWYYKGIKAYVDYLPITNESSLLTQMAWANAHPKEVQKIIEHSTHFVEENLQLEDMYHYISLLLTNYNRLLNKDKLMMEKIDDSH
jgi:hypothetical protein